MQSCSVYLATGSKESGKEREEGCKEGGHVVRSCEQVGRLRQPNSSIAPYGLSEALKKAAKAGKANLCGFAVAVLVAARTTCIY